MKKYLRVIGIIISVLLLVFFILTIIYKDSISTLLTEEVQAYGLIVIFIATTFSEIIPQYVGPQLILIQGGLVDFSAPILTLVIILGSTTGTLLGFFLGKKFGEPIVESFYSKRTDKKIENAINNYGLVFITLAAISPLPYLPIIFGALGIKLRNILFFGLIPRVLTLIILALFFI